MLKPVVGLILRKFRGKTVSDFGGLSASDALLFLIQRGIGCYLRGIFWRLFLRGVRGRILIGRGVRIIAPSKLKAGNNTYIGDYSYISCYSLGGVHLGDNVTIREFAWLQLTSRLDNPGQKIVIGDNTYIGPRACLGAAAELFIGERCQIGANVSFIAEEHAYEAHENIFDQGVKRSGIKIGDDCWIGNNAIILDGVELGDGCVIGAGAVVTRSIQPRSVAVGVPARVVKSR